MSLGLESNKTYKLLSKGYYKDEAFSKTIVLSLGIHALFLVTALLISSSEQKKIFIAPVLSVDLIMDMTDASPKKPSETIKTPQPKPLIEPKPVIDSAEKLTDALNKIKNKISNKRDTIALNTRLKKMKQDKRDEEKRAEEEKKQEAIRAIQARLKVEELTFKTVSASARIPEQKGVSRKISKELFELRFKEYYLIVGERIRSQWVYGGDKSEDLATYIEIKVAPSGKLLLTNIEKSSGNQSFDNSAMNAVKKSAPLPPLPEEINQNALVIGLKFCPSGCQ